jgi:hypothetical protein
MFWPSGGLTVTNGWKGIRRKAGFVGILCGFQPYAFATSLFASFMYYISAKEKEENNALFRCKRGAQECLISPYLPSCNVAVSCFCALVATFGGQVAESSEHDSNTCISFLCFCLSLSRLANCWLANSLGFSPILAGWCVLHGFVRF